MKPYFIVTWYHQWHIQAAWETGIPVWVPKLWRPKNTFKVFLFQSYFNKKSEWLNEWKKIIILRRINTKQELAKNIATS